MNNIENEYNKVSTTGEFSKKYFSYLSKVLDSIDENEIYKMGNVFEN